MQIALIILGVVIVVFLVVLAFKKTNEDICSDIVTKEPEEDNSNKIEEPKLTGIAKKRMLEAEERKNREKRKTTFNVLFTIVYFAIAAPLSTLIINFINKILFRGDLAFLMMGGYIVAIVVYGIFFFLYIFLRKKCYESYFS